MPEIRYRRLAGSGQVTGKPTLLYGVFVQSPSNGVGVTLYDDTAANSEHTLLEIAGLANDFLDPYFRPYLYCERGLYVSFGANVTECLLLFKTIGD